MGIDIYMRWEGQMKTEREAQYTGFAVSAKAGAVGYLREAYHGGPYSTDVLVPESKEMTLTEAIDEKDEYGDEIEGVHIPATVLRERLPKAIEAAHERGRTVYKNPDGDPHMAAALTAFVELAERLEAEGKRILILNSY